MKPYQTVCSRPRALLWFILLTILLSMACSLSVYTPPEAVSTPANSQAEQPKSTTASSLAEPQVSTPAVREALAQDTAPPPAKLEGEAIPFSTPDLREVMAEISLLEVLRPADGTTLQVELSIMNYSLNSLVVAPGAVLLEAGGRQSLPLASQPELPHEIVPGAVQTFAFSFTRPASGAVLRVFASEFDLDDY